MSKLNFVPALRAGWRHLTYRNTHLQILYFAVRTLFGTWVALIAIVAAHIAIVQTLPMSWYLRVERVRVTGLNAVPQIEVWRHTRYDQNMDIIAELHSATDNSVQPCISSYSTEIEVVPPHLLPVRVDLNQVFKRCNFARLVGQRFVVQLSYNLDLDYGIHKRLNVTSEPFTFQPGVESN